MTTQIASSRVEAPLPIRLFLFVAGCGSVIPLLAWVYGLGPFSTWTAVVAVPLVLSTIVFAVWMDRTGKWPGTRAAITAGAIGGLIGAFGYDLFRVPFIYGLGLHLLAPIDSYGVLILGADGSSQVSGFTGWGYHFVNGIGFGVAYGVVARHRSWWWGLLWAMVLETATVLTPFATAYGLITDDGINVLPITLAYLAHIPYGIAIGKAVQHADAFHDAARSVVSRPTLVSVALLAIGLAVWLRPGLPNDTLRQGQQVAPGPSAVVEDAEWVPLWLRVAPGECVAIQNGDATDYQGAATSFPAGETTELCLDRPGIHRVRMNEVPFSGGFVIVDEAKR